MRSIKEQGGIISGMVGFRNPGSTSLGEGSGKSNKTFDLKFRGFWTFKPVNDDSKKTVNGQMYF